jgi:hypothetical protein
LRKLSLKTQTDVNVTRRWRKKMKKGPANSGHANGQAALRSAGNDKKINYFPFLSAISGSMRHLTIHDFVAMFEPHM